MLPYEITKKLQDLGFPPRRHPWEIADTTTGETFWVEGDEPSLEELIDACGAKFWALEWVTNNKWVAHSFGGRITTESLPERSIAGIRAEGRTRKIAVANLFIALRAPKKLKKHDDQTAAA